MTNIERARLDELEALYRATRDATPFDAPQAQQDELRDVHIALLNAQEVYLKLPGLVKTMCKVFDYYQTPYVSLPTIGPREMGVVTHWAGTWGYIDDDVRFTGLVAGEPRVGMCVEYEYNAMFMKAQKVVVLAD